MQRLITLGFSVSVWATVFAQGKIVVANDAWTLSNTGCVNAPEDADQMPPEPLDGASYSRLRGSLCLLLSASFKAAFKVQR
jgi:hypothetical protein